MHVNMAHEYACSYFQHAMHAEHTTHTQCTVFAFYELYGAQP